MPNLKELTRVIGEHQSGLRFFIQSLGVNPAWVDDIAQDTFLIAYRKWSEFDGLDNPGAWLRGIARNLVLNETAKRHRRQRLLDENLTTLLLENDSGEPAPGEHSDWAARRNALCDCLDSLTDRTRQILEARYFQDRNSTEIGQDYAMKPAAVRKLLFNARQALADCLRRKQVETGT